MFGHNFVLVLSSLFSTGSYLLIASSSGSTQLIIGRAIAGLSAGICFTTVPVYIGEVSHFKVKGFFAGFFGLFLRFGTLTAYTLGLLLSFRWLALVPVYIDLLYTAVLVCLCYSPTWLISRRLSRRGVSVLGRLGRSEEEAMRECREIETVLSEREYSGVKDRIASLFQRNNLKALLIGLAYMLLEPMTGTDVIDAYATQILTDTSFILSSPSVAAVFFPLFAIAANFLLLALVDRVGRKVLTVVSGVGIIVCLFSMSVYVFVTDNVVVADVNATGNGYLGVVPVMSLAGVRFLHGLGWGSVGFILLGELFPLKVKSTLAGISSFGSWLVIFSVLLLFPFLSQWIGYGSTFCLLGVANIFSLLFVIFFLPETKQKTVEEIEKLFQGRTVFCLCNINMMHSTEVPTISENINVTVTKQNN